MIARSSRFATKYGEPQCRSDMWAIVNGRAMGAIIDRAVRIGKYNSEA